MLVSLAALLLADCGVARATEGRKSGFALYWVWFGAVVLLAICVTCLIPWVMLLPLLGRIPASE